MSERLIVITEKDGAYKINESDFNGFELLGLLEQIIFDLKHLRAAKITTEKATSPDDDRRVEHPLAEEKSAAAELPPAAPVTESSHQENEKAAAPTAVSPAAELRTRIGNAVKAIKDLGGKTEDLSLDRMSDDELQAELEALTDQYKRLKVSGKKK